MVSLADFEDAKGFIVIFTCNTCPYSVAYEDRIIALDKKYKSKGYPVIAINPNDPAAIEGDELADMKVRAVEKGLPFRICKMLDSRFIPNTVPQKPHMSLSYKRKMRKILYAISVR